MSERRWRDGFVRYQLIQDLNSTELSDFKKRLASTYSGAREVNGALEAKAEGGEILIEFEDFADLTCIISTITPRAGLKVEAQIDRGRGMLDQQATLLPLLNDALMTLDICTPGSSSEDDASVKLEAWSRRLSGPITGTGIAKGCILSMLVPLKGDLTHKNYFLSPTKPSKSLKGFGEALTEIKNIALCSAQLNRLERSSRNYITAYKPGEAEISERIDSYQWELLRPEPVKMETLESWLGYIMEREASLSAMISAVRANLVEAGLIVSRVEDSLRRLNEGSFRDYPSCSEAIGREYSAATRKYDDFIVATEALKARLSTVMENVRTYLSVQQQKLTLDEQKSSKEQLVRLVGLQETFHKIEIFILAVYMTEMARIVFDVVAGEEAGLLTAIFIPVALLGAVGVSRLLHR